MPPKDATGTPVKSGAQSPKEKTSDGTAKHSEGEQAVLLKAIKELAERQKAQSSAQAPHGQGPQGRACQEGRQVSAAEIACRN